jgi:hypothetical protein
MKLANIFRLEPQTLGDSLQTIGIILTTTAGNIQQDTGNTGIEHFIGVFVLQLVQAAFTAAITKGLPLLLIHLSQGFTLPERLLG